jgi:hypothetical protein
MTTTLKAEITMPDLQALQFSGGVIANVEGFNLTHNLITDCSGGSSLTMNGQTVSLSLTGSGGANLHLANLQVQNATVDLSGGSQATVTVDGKLDATLSGGAHLYYRGNPTLGTIDISGGAGISKVS